MVRVLRQWFRRYDLAHHLFCAWRMTCKCSSWFPSRLACSHCARCPQPRKVHLGVPLNPMGALIAATIRGSNARRALTAMTVAPVILGTAKQRIEGSAADNRPQDHAGADALIPPARYPGLRSRASFRLHVTPPTRMITATPRFTCCGSRSYCPSAQRYSIATLRPST
jgi:hypothetical protein